MEVSIIIDDVDEFERFLAFDNDGLYKNNIIKSVIREYCDFYIINHLMILKIDFKYVRECFS